MQLLEIKGLFKSFEGLNAVINFNFSIAEGELVGLIGPNGAGKTTCFNLITGVYRADEGSIRFRGQDIGGFSPHVICRRGIARTFQNIRLFKEMSVLDNVKVALHKDVTYGLFSSILRLPGFFRGEAQMEARALELLRVFGMEERCHMLASNLPYGEQRRLEIARAMATGPALLILDEPAAGMNPQETAALMELIRWLRDTYGVAILLIEHDMNLVMGVCERIYVLDYGQTIAVGLPEEIRSHRGVIEAYLGEEIV